MILVSIFVIYNVIALLTARKVMTRRMDQLIRVCTEMHVGYWLHNRRCQKLVPRGSHRDRDKEDVLYSVGFGLIWPVWWVLVGVATYILNAPLSKSEKSYEAEQLSQKVEQTRRELEKLEKEIM